MYPSIEFFTAMLFVACYFCFGLTMPTFKWLALSGILVVLIVRLRERILPDAVNWFGVDWSGLRHAVPKMASRML